MDRVYTTVTFLFVLVVPFVFVYQVNYDLHHPEIWDADSNHDPRLYLPYCAIVFAMVAIFAWWTRRKTT